MTLWNCAFLKNQFKDGLKNNKAYLAYKADQYSYVYISINEKLVYYLQSHLAHSVYLTSKKNTIWVWVTFLVKMRYIYIYVLGWPKSPCGIKV